MQELIFCAELADGACRELEARHGLPLSKNAKKTVLDQVRRIAAGPIGRRLFADGDSVDLIERGRRWLRAREGDELVNLDRGVLLDARAHGPLPVMELLDGELSIISSQTQWEREAERSRQEKEKIAATKAAAAEAARVAAELKEQQHREALQQKLDDQMARADVLNPQMGEDERMKLRETLQQQNEARSQRLQQSADLFAQLRGSTQEKTPEVEEPPRPSATGQQMH